MAEPAHPTAPDLPPLPHKCQGISGKCPNTVALTSESKCQGCLDKDSARKKGITLEELLKNRALAEQRNTELIAKGLARPPPAAGSHFCHGCKNDLPDAQFDLSISTARCIRHHTMAAEAKKALAEKKKVVVLSSSAAVGAVATSLDADVDVDVETVVYQEKFFTLEAALQFVESRGHTEGAMYLKAWSDQFGSSTYRCHCSDRLRSQRSGTCCSP